MTSAPVLLIAGAGALAGVVLWLGLLRRQHVRGPSPRRLAMVSIAAGLACRVVFAWFTPTFDAPDEQAHFRYVAYLAEHRSLPVQTSRTDSPAHDWEYYQPPAYYLLLTPPCLLAERLHASEFATVRMLRAVSIALWGLTVLLAFAALRDLGVRDPFLRTWTTALLCLLPAYASLSSVINNDNLMIALGAAIFYLAVRRPSLRNSLLLGLVLGLALLTKLTAGVFVALILLIPIVRRITRRPAPGDAGHAVLQVALAALLWLPWAWRNWTLYGSVTGEEIANVPTHWRTPFEALMFTGRYMLTSFWSVAGIHNDVKGLYPVPGLIVTAAAWLGLAYGALVRRDRLAGMASGRADLVGAAALAIAINAALVMRFGWLYGQGQGRFLYPMLIPMALILGMGLELWPAARRANAPAHVVGFLAAYAISFLCFSLAMFWIVRGGVAPVAG